jgi:DNA invertase Pin-like site-specific DNA recombinase
MSKVVKTATTTAVYLRVSSDAQTTASQQADMNSWRKAHAPDALLFTDKFTGKTMDRPAWSRLYGEIQAGRINTVAIWRLDRLGRDVAGVSAILKEFRQRKINLVSLKDGLDLSTPAGTLMANVLASVAQFETEVRAERVAAGQAAAKAKGKKWGGSKPGWHWKVTAEQAAAVREMHQAGKKKTAIARVTGLSRPTIDKLLKAVAAERLWKGGADMSDETRELYSAEPAKKG